VPERRVWLSRRALGLHAVILVIVPTFIGLCIWQVHRALGGNSLSWAYVFEWPFFAGYAVYMWWRFVHEAPDDAPLGASPVPAAAGRDTPAPQTARTAEPDEADEAVAAYNDYLADLAERGKPKRWR
jgi:hypothetical protein